MTREILFRAKRTDNGEWVEGGVVQGVVHELWRNSDRAYITVFPEFLSRLKLEEVDPSTVGQYTGLPDKNGKKIFEGDIVAFTRFNALGYATRRTGVVQYYDKLPVFYIMATTGDAWDWCDCEAIEVIGNKWDNPELLEE